MSSSYTSAGRDNGQRRQGSAENSWQKFSRTQTGDDPSHGRKSHANELYGSTSVRYADKSTQTTSILKGSDLRTVDPNSDSLPDIPPYELSQIISDAIDKLPPGSLQPLEESVFAPGSKRNLEYIATRNTAKELSSKMPVVEKTKISTRNNPQRETKATTSSQSGLTSSNQYASLASSESPEETLPTPPKSLIGPGLYSRSPRSASRTSFPEEPKTQVHTYSPAPGILLRFGSVEQSSKSSHKSTTAEKPGTPSHEASSLAPADPSLHENLETPSGPRSTQLPPHLRIARGSESIDLGEESIGKSIHGDEEFGTTSKTASPEASRSDPPAKAKIMYPATLVAKLIEADREGRSTPQPPITPTGRPGEVKAESLSQNDPFTTTKIKPASIEGGLSSTQPLEESRESKSSLSPQKVPPHLRKSEAPVPKAASPKRTVRFEESKLSPLSSSDKVASQVKKETQVPQQVLQQVLPVNSGKTVHTEPARQPPSGFASRTLSSSNPVPASGTAPGAHSDENVATNLEGVLYFESWPKSEARYTPAAEIRKVIITKLPPYATPSLVTSLVSGGPLEQIHVTGSTAHVLFLHAQDCQKFYDSTANGLLYTFEGREGAAEVDKAADVDVLGGQIRNFIELGFTRCVRAMDVGSDLTVATLTKKAGLKGRNVESVDLGTTESGIRFAVFRFCDIRHAVQFKLALEREEEWENCNIQFSPDPCA